MADQLVPPCPSGIYAIRCHANGKSYIGSAVNIKRRWRSHLEDLKRGNHHAVRMQRSWQKYGPSTFEFVVVEYVPILLQLLEREQYWIDALNAAAPNAGFNTSPTAGSSLGVKHSPEHGAAVSAANKGKTISSHTRALISAAKMGKPISPEHRAILIAVWKGRPHSPEHRAAVSAAKKGKPLSPEHCAAMSAARKGKPIMGARGKHFTAEHRAAISAGLKGKPHTPERRAAISAAKMGKPNLALKGKPLSPERRAQLSESRKGKSLSVEHRSAISAGLKRRALEKQSSKNREPILKAADVTTIGNDGDSW